MTAARKKAKPGMDHLFMQAIDRAVEEGRSITITIEASKRPAGATLGFKPAESDALVNDDGTKDPDRYAQMLEQLAPSGRKLDDLGKELGLPRARVPSRLPSGGTTMESDREYRVRLRDLIGVRVRAWR